MTGLEEAALIIALVLAAAAAALAILLRPKPIPPPAAGLADFTIPTASAAEPIPVVFGTVMIRAPNVVWYGDLYALPIPAPSSGSSGSS